MTTRQASDGPSLLTALAASASGDVIALSAGLYTGPSTGNTGAHYDGVTIKGHAFDPANPVTVQGAPGVVCPGLYVAGSSGLRFVGIDFDLPPWTPAVGLAPQNWNLIQVGAGSMGIGFEDDVFHCGDAPVVGSSPASILLRGVADVYVKRCEFYALHYGVGYSVVAGMTLKNNFFHDLCDDCMRGGGVTDALIAGNRIQNIHSDLTDVDHPDCCQWWDNGLGPSKAVMIRDNLYLRGPTGGAIQGLPFMTIDANTDKDWPEYTDVSILDNFMSGVANNGITLQGVQGFTISGNDLETDERFVTYGYGTPTASTQLAQPQIQYDSCDSGLITNNSSYGFGIDPWVKEALRAGKTAVTMLPLKASTNVVSTGNTVNKTPCADMGAAMLARWLARKSRKFSSTAL